MGLAEEGGDGLGGDRSDPVDGGERLEILARRAGGRLPHCSYEGVPALVAFTEGSAGRRGQPCARLVDLLRHRRIGPRVGVKLGRQRQQLVARLGTQAV